eukprot:scaffold6520_cov140-Skeletonema_marinoi.AAC.5
MADQAVVGVQEAGDIFVYMGAIKLCQMMSDVSKLINPRLIDIEFHDGIETIEKRAFYSCILLRGVKLLGIKVIGIGAFSACSGLIDVEFGDKLETIKGRAFQLCYSLTRIRMPFVRSIHRAAFMGCVQLTDLEFGEALETLQEAAFSYCNRVGRIAIPLRDDMIGDRVFSFCPNLTTVHLVGGDPQNCCLFTFGEMEK